jgi:hypothetical protein
MARHKCLPHQEDVSRPRTMSLPERSWSHLHFQFDYSKNRESYGTHPSVFIIPWLSVCVQEVISKTTGGNWLKLCTLIWKHKWRSLSKAYTELWFFELRKFNSFQALDLLLSTENSPARCPDRSCFKRNLFPLMNRYNIMKWKKKNIAYRLPNSHVNC